MKFVDIVVSDKEYQNAISQTNFSEYAKLLQCSKKELLQKLAAAGAVQKKKILVAMQHKESGSIIHVLRSESEHRRLMNGLKTKESDIRDIENEIVEHEI